MSKYVVGWAKASIFFLLLVFWGNTFAPVTKVVQNGFIYIPEQTLIRLNVEEEVQELMNSASIMDMNGAVIVLHKGHPIYQNIEGMANLRSGELLRDNSAFQLASVSKMFTATATLKLQEQGLIHLDSAVCQYLPEWPYEDQTIRHLLNHRSGLPRYMAVADWYWEDNKRPMRNEDVIDQFATHQPITFFSPDNGFNYCNTNYVVLAELVARISGQSFPEYLQEYIFDPLDMCDAFVYTKADTILEVEVKGYKPGRRRYYQAWQDYIDGVWGDKNVYASIRDMQKFESALWDGEFLSEKSMEEMWTPGSPQRQYNYGLGWRLKVTDEGVLPYHFGWWRGFRTCYIHDRKSGIGLIMLSNMDDSRRLPAYWDSFESLQNIWPELLDS